MCGREEETSPEKTMKGVLKEKWQFKMAYETFIKGSSNIFDSNVSGKPSVIKAT